MMPLATAAYLMGGAFLAVHLPALLAPQSIRRGILAFPRSTWPARILIAVALAWVAIIVLNAPLGRFDVYKPVLYVLAPVSFILIVVYLDELLAPRALGGLLLLLANPILNITRWHDSPYRFVVTGLVYVGIVAGMILVLSPYRFRQALAFWVENDTRCRLGGLIGSLIGGALIFLARAVY